MASRELLRTWFQPCFVQVLPLVTNLVGQHQTRVACPVEYLFWLILMSAFKVNGWMPQQVSGQAYGHLDNLHGCLSAKAN